MSSGLLTKFQLGFSLPKRDPPIRKDRKCSACSKPLPHIGIMNNDPFCSTTCCRKWHEVDATGAVVINRLEESSTD